MRKTLLFILCSLISLSAFARQYTMIAWSDATGQPEQAANEALMIAAIESLPEIEYIDIITDAATWASYLADATMFDDYDAVIICESGGSSATTGYGSIFPKPTILLEPYALHKTGFEWYPSGSMLELHKTYGFTEERYTEVIVAQDHPIFTGFGFNAGDEVVFASGDAAVETGSYAIPLDLAIDDIKNAATPLANNKQAVANSETALCNMWAIEANAKCKRTFLWGWHAGDLTTMTAEYNTLMKNAALWVLDLPITTGVADNTVSSASARIIANELVIKGTASQVVVYNITGNAVLTISNPTSNVDVASLGEGIYVVSVIDASTGAVSTTKSVKQ